jgi:hypothetical protein
MSYTGREVAKFFSGVVAHETLGHWWLGIWGSDLLPWKIGGYTFTSAINAYCMIGWPIVLAVLLYFAWIRKPGNE